MYSLNKKEWICSLFKEWILEESEIRVNLEWIWSEHLCYSLILEWPQGSLGIPEWSLQNEWITQIHSKDWICSLFKEWISETSEIRVNLEWTFVLFTHFGVTSGITRNTWVIPVITPKWVNNTNVYSKFTLISLFSKIHSLKSEHIHSFLLRECM